MYVGGLTVRRPGADPGFMDLSMNPGSEWRGELLEAVGTCKVFVALLSPSYTASEWCGKEWDAFSRRKVTGGDPGGNTGPALSQSSGHRILLVNFRR